MKRKILLALILVMCLCAVTVLSSCDVILDLIFGPSNPPSPGPDDTHVHKLQQKTLDGAETCSKQDSVNYFKCSDCGKCYLDEQGTQLIDEASLGAGHVYVLKYDDNEHYRECALCKEEQEGSRQAHEIGAWLYNSTEHYKQCSVCEKDFNRAAHDETGSCTVCGRRADYKAMCNGRYGRGKLADDFDNYVNMQKLYDKIDQEVRAVHDDEKYDVDKVKIAEDEYGYALSIKCFDYRITKEEAFALVATYRNDNPLYYWISSRVSMITRKVGEGETAVTYVDTVHICVDGVYRLGADRAKVNAKIYAGIDSYLSYVAAEDDKYALTLALHDKLIENINYAYEEDGVTPEDEVWAHNIAGVFDNKVAVCEGYAKAYQLLLNACNVGNVYVTGTSRDEGHAWNLVQLPNNQWYWFDLTWDDQPNLGRGVIYNYFCVTDAEFADDHKVSSKKSGINYLYDLPAAATEPYKTDGLGLNETFADNGFVYRLAGYDRLAIVGCSNSGNVVIESSVSFNGKNYTVRQLDDTALVLSQAAISQVICGAVTLTIPSTVDLIYNKSFISCKTLVGVKFEDVNGWSRYGMTKAPVYTQMPPEQLSRESSACYLLKQLHKEDREYYCVWVKK